MRKYLIAALAAVLSIAVASVALAPERRVPTSPRSSPRRRRAPREAEELDAQAVRQEQPDRWDGRHHHRLPRQEPQAQRQGLQVLQAETLNDQGKAACPAGSKAGGGTAHAVVGPGHAPLKLHRRRLRRRQEARSSSTPSRSAAPSARAWSARSRRPAASTARRSSSRSTRICSSPPRACSRRLVDLQTTLKGKKGKNYLVSSTGCSKRKHNFGVKFTFKLRTRRSRPSARPMARPPRSARSSAETAHKTQATAPLRRGRRRS